MKAHLLTFDIEDWFQSTWNFDHPITERALNNTRSLLKILKPYSAKATFFIQGMVAEKFPDLIREINGEGHELATHGYSHRPVYGMNRAQFRDDLYRSIEVIQSATKTEVIGYRAPDFSINRSCLWSFEILRDAGIRYDSSLFPKKMRRYGFEGIGVDPFIESRTGIFEIPMSVYESKWGRFPFAGGGYLRLYPLALTEYLMRQSERKGRSAVVYMHPYEVNPADFDGMAIPLKVRLHQGLFRARMKNRLEALLRDFRFTTCREAMNESGTWSSKVL